MVKGHVFGLQGARSVHANATALRSAASSPDSDIHRTAGDLQEPPMHNGTAVAYCRAPVVEDGDPTSRSPSHGENSRRIAPLGRKRCVTDGVDTPMHSVQAP